MVSIRVSTFCFEKLAQDKEITAVLLLQRDNPVTQYDTHPQTGDVELEHGSDAVSIMPLRAP